MFGTGRERLTFYRVAYDHPGAVAAIRCAGLPDSGGGAMKLREPAQVVDSFVIDACSRLFVVSIANVEQETFC